MSVLQALAAGVTIVDREGRMLFSNEASDRILGTPATDLAPEGWASHFGVFRPGTEEPFPTGEYPLVRALTGEETHDIPMLIRNPRLETEALIEVSGRPLRDEDGTIHGAAVVFRDVTELRRAQAELERVNLSLKEAMRRKDELCAFMAHDLKNPLTTVMALAELILDAPSFDEEAVTADVSEIRDQAIRMHQMVLDLLDVHLAEDGKLRPELEDVELASLFGQLRSSVRIRAPGLEVGAPEPPELSARLDPRLMLRVLVNLVDNGVKYGPEGGAIIVQARARERGGIRIEVRDHGPGIPQEFKEKVFEKYTQIERDRPYHAGASRGLGLRFCKVVVEAHGGTIRVEDAEPSGARFVAEIPATSE